MIANSTVCMIVVNCIMFHVLFAQIADLSSIFACTMMFPNDYAIHSLVAHWTKHNIVSHQALFLHALNQTNPFHCLFTAFDSVILAAFTCKCLTYDAVQRRIVHGKTYRASVPYQFIPCSGIISMLTLKPRFERETMGTTAVDFQKLSFLARFVIHCATLLYHVIK